MLQKQENKLKIKMMQSIIVNIKKMIFYYNKKQVYDNLFLSSKNINISIPNPIAHMV